ncbi:MAG: metallophosphoesterase [Candidatus Nanoarchaeia archaeon]
MDESQIIAQLIQSGELPTVEKIKSLLPKDTAPIPITKPKVVASDTSVEVLTKEIYQGKKIEVRDFVTYFRNRYNFFKNLFLNRPELSDAVSINKLRPGGKATIIVSIFDMKKLPTGTIKLCVEDVTGQLSAIISAKNITLIEKARSLALDEIVALKGSASKDNFFVDDIIWPDTPQKIRQKAPDEVYLACLADPHIGSKMFLQKEFEKAIKWLRSEYGNNKQRELAKKTKYIVIGGDIVDGVGIYPTQERELEIKDIYKQYEAAAKFLSQIPDDKHIIVLPGNHDALRICEPQHALFKDLAEPLYKLSNVIMAPNPSYVRIHKQENFSGIDLLLYHGYSFDYFVENIEALRLAGGYDAIDKVWEFLLKRRHLAPTYGATLALPIEDDPLLIKQIPDIAISGHVHKSKIGNYKGVLTIGCSCFQSTTTFQQKMGHNPDPCRVPLVNLQTGKARILRFK